MSIEQEINRNTMTIAELVKAVRELTEAIKGTASAAARAGDAFDKATTAVTDFARIAAPTSVTIDTLDETLGATALCKPIEQGPFFWSHPDSKSFGWLGTREEMRACFAQNRGCVEITGDQYDELVAADLKADEVKATQPKEPIEPDPRPFTEVVAEQVVEEAQPADQNRYFHDTVHRAAYKISPTEPLNGLQARAGVEEINAEQYAVLKAEYTKLTDQVIAGNVKAAPAEPTAAPAAAAPSPTVTSSEPPRSEPEPAASPAELATPVAEPTWPEVHATLMRLVKTAGCGAPQLIALLEDFGVKRPETALALQTKAVGRFAEIIANAELRMKGGAA